jgi:hypothetical protein
VQRSVAIFQAGIRELAEQIITDAAGKHDLDGNVRLFDERDQLLLQKYAQLLRRLPGDLHRANQRELNGSIIVHHEPSQTPPASVEALPGVEADRQLRVTVDGDQHRVARANLIRPMLVRTERLRDERRVQHVSPMRHDRRGQRLHRHGRRRRATRAQPRRDADQERQGEAPPMTVDRGPPFRGRRSDFQSMTRT